MKPYVLNPTAAELFKQVILDAYSNSSLNERDNRKLYIDQISILSNKLTKAREFLLNGDIDGVDYKTIKMETEQNISVLEAKVAETKTDFIKVEELEPIVDGAIYTLTKIDVIYWQSESNIQRKIIGSMYPEKFTFESLQHRTATVGDVFKITYLINKQLEGNKTGQLTKIWCYPVGCAHLGSNLSL